MVQLQLVYEGDEITRRVHALEREVDGLLSDLGRDPSKVEVLSRELSRLKELRGF